MFVPIQPPNFYKFIKKPIYFPINPQNTLVQPTPPNFETYKVKIMSFLTKSKEFEHKTDIKDVKTYYNLPFESLPQNEETLQILTKIIQRSFILKFYVYMYIFIKRGESNNLLSKNWYKEELQLLTLFCLRQSFMRLVDIKNFVLIIII